MTLHPPLQHHTQNFEEQAKVEPQTCWMEQRTYIIIPFTAILRLLYFAH